MACLSCCLGNDHAAVEEALAAASEKESAARAALIDEYELPEKEKAFLFHAAEFVSLPALQRYLKQDHHAYDGHSAAEHVRMRVPFAPPFSHTICPECGEIVYNQDPEGQEPAWSHHYTGAHVQYSRFPVPLKVYAPEEQGMDLWQKLVHRAGTDPFNIAATVIFLLAILHTFLTPRFHRLAGRLEHSHREKLREEKFLLEHPGQRMPVSVLSTMCHFLGEVEVVFGLWTIPFLIVCCHYYSMQDFLLYVDHDTRFTEPLFVAVIMVVASSRPIYRLAENTLQLGANLGKCSPAAWWFSVLSIAPLLGSLITEPAAMTLGAILLAKKFYYLKPSISLRYATLALLFVNVSVGGTLTHFAAPPIVMVAGKWNWDMVHMFTQFGWKAVAGIAISNVLYFFFFRKEFARLAQVQREEGSISGHVPNSGEERQDVIPVWVYAVSIFFLAWTVYFAHHPAILIGGFLFFLGFSMATPQCQNAVSMKVPLLVAFFMAGLLILGGVQGWWMQPVLQELSELGGPITMAMASVLTAFNDNASVTFLASTVSGLSDEMKYAIVAGAVTGGGLTVIANAPNPAGMAILSKFFNGVGAMQLFFWALLPTAIVFCIFNFIS